MLKKKTLALAAILLIFSATSLAFAFPQTVNAEKKDTEEIKKVARAYCDRNVKKAKDSTEYKSCLTGYSSGYNLSKENSCKEAIKKAVCTAAVSAGIKQRQQDTGDKPDPGTDPKSSCDDGNFFGFPTWHKYLSKNDLCAPELGALSDVWKILLAIIEMLLRVAMLIALVYVVIGGFKYVTSEGSPDKTATAKKTIIDGLIGLVIAITATGVVAFIGRSFQG